MVDRILDVHTILLLSGRGFSLDFPVLLWREQEASGSVLLAGRARREGESNQYRRTHGKFSTLRDLSRKGVAWERLCRVISFLDVLIQSGQPS